MTFHERYLAGCAALAVAALVTVSPTRAQDAAALNAEAAQKDWPTYHGTYKSYHYSGLDQINTGNVKNLEVAWMHFPERATRGLQSTPLAIDGVLYYSGSYSRVYALDGATGKTIWAYAPELDEELVSKQTHSPYNRGIAIGQGNLYVGTVDGRLIALNLKTGQPVWDTKLLDSKKVTVGFTGAPLVVKDMVIIGAQGGEWTGRGPIFGVDGKTGQKKWEFFTVAGTEEAMATWGGDSWRTGGGGGWMPGTYDPETNSVWWGTANPAPLYDWSGADWKKSGPRPGDNLYTTSVIALDPDTGKLKWYYQHLPADDWDMDYTHERTLVREKFNPDPKYVKWFNPDIPRGEEHDVAVMVGEGGGVFEIDRGTGQFLWATPFPYDDPLFLISNIDGKTGKVTINYDLVNKKPGEEHVICSYNTRSFWPTAFDPDTNSLYVPYIDNCLDMTSASGSNPREQRKPVPRPGSDPNALTAIGKINLETGEVQRINVGRSPSDGAALVTAGGLLFQGDLNRRFRAFDAQSGKKVWESILGGSISVSTITYAVNGKQYVAVMTGNGLLDGVLLGETPELHPPRGINGIYAFALPDNK